MAKLFLLATLSVYFVIFAFHAQATQPSQRQSQCQVQNIDALEPSRTLQSEAGVTEHWDENDNQLECAGVAVIRHTIQPNGLLLPHFHNAPKLTYIVQGEGVHGAAIPGCPEAYQSPQQSQQQQQQQSQYGTGQQRMAHGDQHQKVRSVYQGDIVATPVGVASWFHNNGQSPLVLVTLLDTSNNDNQLDNYRRSFYLAGNIQQQRQQQGSRQGRRQQEPQSNNIFSVMDDQLLAEVLGIESETVRKLQGVNDNRGNIIRVEGGLRIVSPQRIEQERQQQQQQQGHGQGQENGIEQSRCNMKLRANIDNPNRADVYNPLAGRITRINSNNLPILNDFQLNAERGVLYRNALMAPHWNMNAHSVIYVTRGTAQVQIVGNYQQPIYNGELRRGQVLVVPQNFAVVKRAGDRGFEWVAFKTNDNALVNPIAGRTSVLRALPEEVLMNAFRISRDEANRLKYNRQEVELFAPIAEYSHGRASA